MRILLLSHLFPKASDPRHGIFVQRQAERLRDLGHEIVVVVPVPYLPSGLWLVPRWRRYRRQRDPHNAGGFEVYLPPYFRPPGGWFLPYAWFTTYLAARRTMRRLHASTPFHVLYCQDFSADVLAGVRIAQELDIPCVGMSIGADLNHCDHGIDAYRRAIVRGLEACDAVVCNSPALVEKVAALTQGRQSAEFITRGVDLRRFHPVEGPARTSRRQKFGLPKEAMLILYAGYLERRKGVFELIEAFGRVAHSHRDAHLVLAGEGCDRRELTRRAAETGVAERIWLLGHVEHEHMPWLLQACDIAAMTSWAEGMPNALIEAIACGLPTVGTNVGGIPQAVLHERSGLLVPPRDVVATAAALERMLGDVGCRARFGLEAHRIALTRFDAHENTRRLAALLERTARAYRARTRKTGVASG